jgi:hypothetical protein
LADEKARLNEAAAEDRARLQERLADEKANYAERQTALDDAYNEQLTTIRDKSDEQVQLTEEKAHEVTQNYIDAWQELDPAIASALQGVRDRAIYPILDEIARTAYDKGREAGESYAQGFQDGVDYHSVPQWAIDVGQSVGAGLTAGMRDMRGLAMQAGAGVQQTVQAAVSPQAAAAAGTTSVSNTRNYNVNYTGQVQSEEGIRSMLTMMEMAANG